MDPSLSHTPGLEAPYMGVSFIQEVCLGKGHWELPTSACLTLTMTWACRDGLGTHMSGMESCSPSHHHHCMAWLQQVPAVSSCGYNTSSEQPCPGSLGQVGQDRRVVGCLHLALLVEGCCWG